MKTLIKALALSLLFAGCAQAEIKPYIGAEYNSEQRRDNDHRNIGLSSILGFKTSDGMDYSVKTGMSQPTYGAIRDISYNIEIRAKKTFDLGYAVKPYLGFRLGEKMTKTENFMNYSVDTGILVPLTQAATLDLGYRFRDNSGSDTAYDSDRYHVKTSYRLDPHNVVSFSYLQSYGAAAESKNTWRFSYAYNF